MPAMRKILEKALELQNLGKSDEAIQIFDAVLGKTIDDPYALYCAGTAFLCKGMFGVAMTLLSQSLQVEDAMAKESGRKTEAWFPSAWNNLAACLKHEKHRDLAIKAYRSALEHTYDAHTLGNLSGIYINAGEPETCVEIARKALELDPYQPQAAMHYALAKLELGEFEEGFRWYNSRLRIPEFDRRSYPGPLWTGGRVGTLVVHGEQGVGDEIMFSSLIRHVQQRVGTVVVECVPKLAKTLERSFGVQCYPDEKTLREAHPKTDAWIPMGSLPAALGIYPPLVHAGYMKPDPERVAYWKAKYPGPRIGLSWRGGTKFTHWELRNFSAAEWKPLTAGRGLISLQYGDWGHEIRDLGLIAPELQDFDDHMALVSACDLVISVCNTTVHMAGSMNVQCWCLVPSQPAWRYGMKGDRMAWYPSVKFYRQTGEWSEVIERLRHDLDNTGIPALERDDAPVEADVWHDRGAVRESRVAAG